MTPNMQSPRVSVIVVSYNTRDELRRCLSCIEPEHEVIVVDNASDDGSPQMVQAEFPHVRLICNTENVGFGAANNQGMAAAERPLVLLLNSDCYASPGAIAKLARLFEDEAVVAAGGELHHPDGSLQESVAAELTLRQVFLEQSFLDRLPLLRALQLSYWRTRGAQKAWELTGRGVGVDQVTGACLMMRPVARFDERFFLYCEDTELCHRLKGQGKIWYTVDAKFTHALGSSSRKEPWRGIALYNRGKELYFELHYGQRAATACLVLNRFGAMLRTLIWVAPTVATLGLVGRFRRQVATFWRVLVAPRQGPPRPTRSPG